MNAYALANLPRWAVALLVVLLFVVAPCAAHLLDGPSEPDAAVRTAAASRDVEARP